ncbi:MAG: preprotein translocase subunit SecG [Treponema sp.]|jgi:preprotein translocase subunit SecG|nr:preprotein translocase subunit SecG [Treponema sp.]
MGILSIVLLVFFVITAILRVLLVLAQNEEGDSLGGIFAGGSASAFGSRSGNVLTRATTVLGALFLIISLALALVNRTPGGSGVEKAALEQTPEGNTSWFLDEETSAAEATETEAAPEGASEGAAEGEAPAAETQAAEPPAGAP